MVKNEKEVVEAYQVRSLSASIVIAHRLESYADANCSVSQWSSASSSWQKIGEVVDAVGSNRRQLYNGVEYDHVFDVDIQEGAPPLKLPYNTSG